MTLAFISCVPGLESVLAKEVEALGFTPSIVRAGVEINIKEFSDVYRLNFLLRTCSRVLLLMKEFSCATPNDLYENILDIDWAPYFQGLPTLAIDTTVLHNPNFTNTLFASQKAKDAICDRLRKSFGERPSVDTARPDLHFVLFIEGKKAKFYFDTSGTPLHVRGYRDVTSKAPLRENLAAGLLLLTSFSKDNVLLDPCCGAGTFLVEAALIASNTPPGYLRKTYGFMKHPEYSSHEWGKVYQEHMDARIPLKKESIFGVEKSSTAYTQLAKVLYASGFEKDISVSCRDFRTYKVPETVDFLITNPPYGVRLQDDYLEDFYKELGDFFKHIPHKPSKGCIFTAQSDLIKKIGLKTSKRHILSNGGIDCRLLEFDLY